MGAFPDPEELQRREIRIDLTAVDPNVRPQDDLFAHVNGPGPCDADSRRPRSLRHVRRAARDRWSSTFARSSRRSPPADPQSGTVAKVGDLYASFMDEDVVEALGKSHARAGPARAAAVSSPDEVMATSGTFGRAGILGLVMPFVNTDDRDPSRYVVYLEQAGLGLPDESYYREEQHADKRAAYVGHVERMLALAGWPALGRGGRARHGAGDPGRRRALGQGDQPRPR